MNTDSSKSTEELRALLLEFAAQIATDGMESAGQFEREAVTSYYPQFKALIRSVAEQVAEKVIGEAEKYRIGAGSDCRNGLRDEQRHALPQILDEVIGGGDA